jgi:hypothetical protein
MFFMAADCARRAQDWKEALRHFEDASKLFLRKRSFQRAIDALEGARECQKSLGKETMINETEERIESVKHQIPRNLEECFMELEWQLKRARTLRHFKEITKEKIFDDYFNLSISIRRWWGLNTESDLADYFKGLGTRTPEEMSRRILTDFHERLSQSACAEGRNIERQSLDLEAKLALLKEINIEKGFLRPEEKVEYEISRKMDSGKTREEAIKELYEETS